MGIYLKGRRAYLPLTQANNLSSYFPFPLGWGWGLSPSTEDGSLLSERSCSIESPVKIQFLGRAIVTSKKIPYWSGEWVSTVYTQVGRKGGWSQADSIDTRTKLSKRTSHDDVK